MAKQAQTLATLYALTGDLICGHWARDILLRFAHVYPNYLVHSSYGDWIDLPPHLVAENINDLPEDEWTIPPNKPDRTLHTGYWSAGRAMGVGLEGHFVRNVTVAYDFIHDLLTEDERLKIETDLLLESTVLLLADPDLNNKSVANLSAAGLVGMAVGAPSLVDAGSKGFWHFVRNWYLPVGTTSESPSSHAISVKPCTDTLSLLPTGTQHRNNWIFIQIAITGPSFGPCLTPCCQI